MIPDNIFLLSSLVVPHNVVMALRVAIVVSSHAPLSDVL